jgi:hypothetical protein
MDGLLDPMLAAAVRNLGESYLFPAVRLGWPTRTTATYLASDAGIPVTAPPNNVTLLSRPRPEEVPQLVVEWHDFFSGEGGGWQVWSIWPDVDLSSEGFTANSDPCLIRPPGGSAPAAPTELTVVEVTDERTRVDLEAMIISGFGVEGLSPGNILTQQVFGDPRYRSWVGYVNGAPVCTATAYRGAGLVGVYSVATLSRARRRGYGEALTWVATMSAAELPATLQASPMGLALYLRMGYQVVGTFTVWEIERRLPADGAASLR